MRVLATFPEVFDPPAGCAAGPAAIVQPAGHLDPAPLPATVSPSLAPRSRGPRPIRIAPRPRFPIRSIALLAIVTAAVWALVAVRERAEPVGPGPEIQLAAEPVGAADAGVSR